MRRCWIFLVPFLLLACKGGQEARATTATPAARLVAVAASQPVTDDPDDPAIWIDAKSPERSVVVGTNKIEKPGGALLVFDLQGNVLQTIAGLDRPNNVDIEQDVLADGKRIDIVAVTERKAKAVRLYRIDAEARRLTEDAIMTVFDGEADDFGEPMGIAIYKRADDAVFLILSRKTGPTEGYLWQYRLRPGPQLTLVRKFGKFSGAGEIEAVLVDDAAGYVYYADEMAGIRKYHADPDRSDAAQELALFGTSGYAGDREGLALYSTGGQTGYIVSTDQIDKESRYMLYRREGSPGNPHDHRDVVAVLQGTADSTDGIEVVSRALSRALPRGMLVAMNSGPKNFLFFEWPSLPIADGDAP